MALPAAVVVLVVALVALFVVTGSEDGGYRVRAIFDNAGFVIPGEDVKVAGVKVGQVQDVEVTPEFKAAVVLRIDDAGYQDFRADAKCTVRPQSLIGERFVECEPTQRHAVGAESPGRLRRIERGPGAGQYLLPVRNTSKSVDLDLVNDIMRKPYSQRLSIILNELGTGLAGRGGDLNAVIRRADPALKEVDGVLRLLARQNKQLERLAADSDTILAPLARERAHVGSAIANSSAVAGATAERRVALEADIQRLPRFLRELRPTMTRLGALADEMTPVVSDLGDVAPDVNRFLLELGPFSQAGIPAVRSLGDASRIGKPAIETSLPVIRDLRTFARAARPVGTTLRTVLESFQRTDGIRRAMDYLFYQAAAVNGFDSFGHYLRAGLIVNQCSNYSIATIPGCSSNFASAASASAAGASAMPRDKVLAWTARVLQGFAPVAATAPKAGKQTEQRGKRTGKPGYRAPAAPQPAATPAPATVAQPVPQAPAATPTAAPPAADGVEPLLDYLFGGDG